MHHIYHENGPWDDDCPRCQEWAEHPFSSLDDANLIALHDVTVQFMKDGYMRPENYISETHMKAVRVMERHLMEAAHLARCKSSVKPVMSV